MPEQRSLCYHSMAITCRHSTYLNTYVTLYDIIDRCTAWSLNTLIKNISRFTSRQLEADAKIAAQRLDGYLFYNLYVIAEGCTIDKVTASFFYGSELLEISIILIGFIYWIFVCFNN